MLYTHAANICSAVHAMHCVANYVLDTQQDILYILLMPAASICYACYVPSMLPGIESAGSRRIPGELK